MSRRHRDRGQRQRIDEAREAVRIEIRDRPRGARHHSGAASAGRAKNTGRGSRRGQCRLLDESTASRLPIKSAAALHLARARVENVFRAEQGLRVREVEHVVDRVRDRVERALRRCARRPASCPRRSAGSRSDRSACGRQSCASPRARSRAAAGAARSRSGPARAASAGLTPGSAVAPLPQASGTRQRIGIGARLIDDLRQSDGRTSRPSRHRR